MYKVLDKYYSTLHAAHAAAKIELNKNNFRKNKIYVDDVNGELVSTVYKTEDEGIVILNRK